MLLLMTEKKIKCSKCEAQITVEENFTGKNIECPECNNAILPPVPCLKSDMQVGDFILIRRIGSGGMGEVWLAEQPAMDRSVALKILSPSLTGDKKFVSRFMQEVKTSAKLQQPNIGTAFHAGVDKGLYYLAISYIDGMELRESIILNKTIPEDESLKIIRSIAVALKYAWNKFKIIHRDIKPSNIMLDEETGEPHLMDMGISKSVIESSDLTIAGTLIGTPYYMSPEHARMDKEMDCRSDIYSLGATFYHILTGDVPYDAPNTVGVLSKLISAPLPSPKEKNPSISDSCSSLIETMMSKSAADRQQTWEEVIKDIDKLIKSRDKDSSTKSVVLDKKSSKGKTTGSVKVKITSKISPETKKRDIAELVTLVTDPSAKEYLCPHCGSVNKPGARFCMGCGKGICQKCP